jgi:hypothetical protein
VEPQFTSAGDFSEGFAAVETKDRTGYIDPNGQWVLELEDASHGQFSQGLADIYFDERVDFIRVDGSVAFSFDTTEPASGFLGGLSTMELEPERWGFIDLDGEVAIPPAYYSLSQFSDGLARVSVFEDDEEVFGFIDKKGKVVIEPKFRFAQEFSDGRAVAFLSDGVYGFIDKKGKWAIAPQFEDAEDFSDGLAAVSVDIDEGPIYINKQGKAVIELGPDCEAAEIFRNGLAHVRFSDKVQFIDKKGKAVWEGEW